MDVTRADIRRQLCRPIIGFRRRQIYALNLNMDEPIQLQFRARRPSEIRGAMRKHIVKAFHGAKQGEENGEDRFTSLHCELATTRPLPFRNLFRRLAI